MFTMSIRVADFLPFKITGSATSLLTAVTVMESGLQSRLPITVIVTWSDGNRESFTSPTTRDMITNLTLLLRQNRNTQEGSILR